MHRFFSDFAKNNFKVKLVKNEGSVRYTLKVMEKLLAINYSIYIGDIKNDGKNN